MSDLNESVATGFARTWKVSARTMAAVLLLVAAAALAARGLSSDVPAWAALRVVLAALAVGIVPGAAALMAARAGVLITELELLGFGFVLSFVVVQLLAIGAITGHWSALVSLTLLAVVTAVCLGIAVRRRAEVTIQAGRLLFLIAVTLVGGLLYVQGAPYSSAEDQIHVALARRLAFWDSPSLEELYFVTGVQKGFYPYPFPAIHYLISLITRVSDLDTFFVYHKLRAFWGPIAMSMVYLAAAPAFGATVAMASAVTAVVFVLNGTFSNSYNFFWGQLTPFSHASDVALGVLLPALIVLTCRYAVAPSVRDRVFFGVTALALTGSLCIVHAREVVQQLVYLGALTLACLATADDRRRRLSWAAGLTAATIALALAYRAWQAEVLGFVNVVVEAQRAQLFERLRDASWFDLLIGTPSTDTPGAQLLFLGWNPLTLLLAPVVLYAFRGALLPRFIGLSILIYLLIVRFPVFTLPYIAASYFEITVSGMRNFIFFIHILTGVSLWVIAAWLARLNPLKALAAGFALVAAMAGLWRIAGTWLFWHQDWFFVPLIAASAAVLVATWRRAPGAAESPVTRRAVATWAALTLVMAAWTFVPGSVMASNAAVSGSPFTMRLDESVKTPRQLFAVMGGCFGNPDQPLPFQPDPGRVVTSGEFLSCPPPWPFLEWARQSLPVNAVVAASKFNPYPMSVFLPVKMVAWPSMTLTYHNETDALRTYYELWNHALRTHGAQPFFNASETTAERERFVASLGVTHVVLDPHYYSLKAALDRETGLLARVYDDGAWAVFEVRR